MKAGVTFVTSEIRVGKDAVISAGSLNCTPAPGKIASLVSAFDVSRVMNVYPNRRVTLYGIWLIDGYSGADDGGVLLVQDGATVQVRDAVIAGGRSEANGGCVAVGPGATLDLVGTSVIGRCTAGGDGGAVYVDGSFEADATFRMWDDARIEGATLVPGGPANTAGGDGGAIYAADAVVALYDQAMITGDASAVLDASGRGGALYAEDALVVLEGSATISGATAGERGGCVALAGDTEMYAVDSVEVSGCVANGKGGGGVNVGTGTLLELRDSVHITGNLVDVGTDTAGGGVRVEDGAAFEAYDDVLISGNSGPVSGGGIALDGDGATALLSGRVIVELNTASQYGGGISVAGDGARLDVDGEPWVYTTDPFQPDGHFVEVDHPDASGVRIGTNKALCAVPGCYGGGVFVGDGAAMGATNLVVFDNEAGTDLGSNPAHGGGIAGRAADLELVNVAVNENKAFGSGGGIWVGGITSEVTLEDASLLMTSDFPSCALDRTQFAWTNHYCSEVRANLARMPVGGVPFLTHDGSGGGIHIEGDVDATMQYTALLHNVADGHSGSILATPVVWLDNTPFPNILRRPSLNFTAILSGHNLSDSVFGVGLGSVTVTGFAALDISSSTIADDGDPGGLVVSQDEPVTAPATPAVVRGNVLYTLLPRRDGFLLPNTSSAIGTCNVGNFNPALFLAQPTNLEDDPELALGIFDVLGEFRPSTMSPAIDFCNRDSPYDIDGTCRPDDNCLPGGGGAGAGGNIDAGAIELY